jgi:protein-tyrosine phosphatase
MSLVFICCIVSLLVPASLAQDRLSLDLSPGRMFLQRLDNHVPAVKMPWEISEARTMNSRVPNSGSKQVMKRLLFLCTGNYYRSRYAELLFNAVASTVRLAWRADSRGLDLSAGKNNVGPLSTLVAERLKRRGFGLVAAPRMPQQVSANDFAAADLVIALKKAEHQPMIMAKFAEWVHRVEYWHVHDTDQAPPYEALSLIEREIERLLARLTLDSYLPQE